MQSPRLFLSLQMSDQESNSSDRLSESHTEGDMEGETERDEEVTEKRNPHLFQLSSSLRAVIRIRQKYQAMKKRRLEMSAGLGGLGALTGAPSRTSPKIFTFDGLTPSTLPPTPSSVPLKRKRRRRGRVLFPSGGGCRRPPKQDHSRAKSCLFLFCAIVFLQVRG